MVTVKDKVTFKPFIDCFGKECNFKGVGIVTKITTIQGLSIPTYRRFQVSFDMLTVESQEDNFEPFN